MICERFSYRRVFALALAIAGGLTPVWAAPSPAWAGGTRGILAGRVVTASGGAVAWARVQATGAGGTLSAISSANGRFSFGEAKIGVYEVTAEKGGLRATLRVALGARGTDLVLRLGRSAARGVPLKVIQTIVASDSVAPPVHGSGTDLTFNRSLLAHSPAATSLSNLLAQLPGAARGANGVVHVNGDHGDVNYIVDGVSMPQQLNREIGDAFDIANAAHIEVMEGAYPAQYGGRFAAVIDIATPSGAGPAGLCGYTSGGTYGTFDSFAAYHQPFGSGSFVLAIHGSQTLHALDPPQATSIHNRGSDLDQFFRLTLRTGRFDAIDFTLSHALQTFEVPNDVSGGEPTSTDDNETQNDTFAALRYRHVVGSRGLLSFGPSYQDSRIRDFGDPTNDFTYGIANNIANGGSVSACADAIQKPAGFSPTTCGYSLRGDSRAINYAFNVDYSLASSVRHTLRYGATYDAALVPQAYAITLQPRNFLAPIYTPETPADPYTVVDDASNVGHTESAYLQDSWKMGPDYELDSGLRVDSFQLFSSQFHDGAGQMSPRLKFARFFGPRASAYVYYGRFFTPFSLQNVSPMAAAELNLPLQRGVAAYDLKPQRDSDYEVGAHVPVGSGDLGLRVAQKDATDLIDDTQVGVTALHQDINYRLGRIATQTLYYQVPLARSGRFYVSANHTYSVNQGCETQLLAPCFGAPTGWTPADHMQPWGASAGVIANDRRAGWLSVASEYGSGLSSSACATTTPGFCSYTPHLVLDVEKGIAIGAETALSLRLGNILNDRYFVTYENAQGNHFARGRTISLSVRYAR